MQILSRRNIERVLTVVGVALLLLLFLGPPRRVEYLLLDFRFFVNRLFPSDGLEEAVVVLLVDPDSETRMGRTYDATWREFYPTIIDKIERSGARAIVWDAEFAADLPEFDGTFSERLAQGIPVVAGTSAAGSTSQSLRDSFAGIGRIGTFAPAKDGVPRYVETTGESPALSTLAASFLDLGLDTSVSSRVWIDYSFDQNLFRAFSIADLYEADHERLADAQRTPLSIFQDRLVFVGFDLPGGDLHLLPGGGSAPEPGVLGQVAATLSQVANRKIWRLPLWTDWIIMAVLAATVVFLGTVRARSLRRVAVPILLGVGFLAPVVFFAALRLWLPYSGIIVAVVAPAGMVTLLQRIKLRRSYRTSLGFDPELIEQHRELIESYATGVEREAAILCADIRNFTQYVTDNPADVVQKVIGGYMAGMEGVIHEFGGYVNKYVGDEIIAVFGFPLNETGIVQRSVDAGLAMLTRLEELQNQWESDGLPRLDGIGIGIDAGPLRFTHVGGRHRVQFDILGSPINGASRLQTLTKEHKRQLILPAEVVEQQDALDVIMFGTPDQEKPEMGVSFLGEVMVRGQGRRRVYGLETHR